MNDKITRGQAVDIYYDLQVIAGADALPYSPEAITEIMDTINRKRITPCPVMPPAGIRLFMDYLFKNGYYGQHCVMLILHPENTAI